MALIALRYEGCQHGSVPWIPPFTAYMEDIEFVLTTGHYQHRETSMSAEKIILNCAGGPRVQSLESCSHEICRTKKIRLASRYERHTFQNASERAVLKYSSGTCWYHQVSCFNISHTVIKKKKIKSSSTILAALLWMLSNSL